MLGLGLVVRVQRPLSLVCRPLFGPQRPFPSGSGAPSFLSSSPLGREGAPTPYTIFLREARLVATLPLGLLYPVASFPPLALRWGRALLKPMMAYSFFSTSLGARLGRALLKPMMAYSCFSTSLGARLGRALLKPMMAYSCFSTSLWARWGRALLKPMMAYSFFSAALGARLGRALLKPMMAYSFFSTAQQKRSCKPS